ncbi:MAG: PQQ-dependent sugar dehydrogenase [Myxococcota bacterium]|nr:PQQ-dependent sugar dehydrogenase [Myxococcota bacterium]
MPMHRPPRRARPAASGALTLLAWARRRALRAGAVLALLGALTGAPPAARAQGQALRLATGLPAPTYVTAPAGDPRLFVVLRGGVIRVLVNDALEGAPFLDIAERVATDGEGGLLGLAFAPDHAESGVFYLYYTADVDPGGGVTFESRVARFRTLGDPATSNAADPASEEILFRLEQPATSHNGGTIAIRDDWLYLGLGDGGGRGDPNDTAQNDASWLGKLLRFDTAQSVLPWQPEVWAKGLRNPFRWSFDRATGDLYVGDVGQSTREEITVEPADSAGGHNFGWDVLEGSTCFDPDPGLGEPACDDPSLLPPTFEYGSGIPDPPSSSQRSVTGGAVYRGARSPSLRGVYFFADFFAARLWSFRWNPLTGEAEDFRDRSDEFPPDAGAFSQIAAIAEDGFGELHVVSLHGSVYRLVPEADAAALAAAGALTLLAWARRRARHAAPPEHAGNPVSTPAA